MAQRDRHDAVNRTVFTAAFIAGLAVVAWVAWGFAGVNALALVMTLLIAATYGLGGWELRRFRAQTTALADTVAATQETPPELDSWLAKLPAALRPSVRLRIEGERVALPGPALAPYLVGLLVMLGMLGTFLGMVVTFQGAVRALEGSADLLAIRTALAAPIKGLGLSFGTSVAGVAASAMLGLLVALSRRERVAVARQLDVVIATHLRSHSGAHQRQATHQALQAQAEAWPTLLARLQTLADGLEQRSQHGQTQLLAQQQAFQQEVSGHYGALARDVGQALQHSLVAAADAASQSLRPVVASAMAELAAESARQHERQVALTQDQLQRWTDRFQASAAQTQAAMAAQAEAQSQQLATAMTDLLARSDALVQARTDAETVSLRQHGERLDGLVQLWRQELATLREAEAARADAAVTQLGELQSAMASQLATLGTALEAPLGRLLHTVAEVPQAAAEVITRLREESTRLAERDGQVLQERTHLLAQMEDLLTALRRSADEQRQAVAEMTTSSQSTLADAGARWHGLLAAQAETANAATGQVQASTTELAQLGESFQQGMALFQASNAQLIDGLQRVEAALTQSLTRSDEQLAYYVAQAREVIDLSIASQQGILDDLRRLRHAPVMGTAA